MKDIQVIYALTIYNWTYQQSNTVHVDVYKRLLRLTTAKWFRNFQESISEI